MEEGMPQLPLHQVPQPNFAEDDTPTVARGKDRDKRKEVSYQQHTVKKESKKDRKKKDSIETLPAAASPKEAPKLTGKLHHSTTEPSLAKSDAKTLQVKKSLPSLKLAMTEVSPRTGDAKPASPPPSPLQATPLQTSQTVSQAILPLFDLFHTLPSSVRMTVSGTDQIQTPSHTYTQLAKLQEAKRSNYKSILTAKQTDRISNKTLPAVVARSTLQVEHPDPQKFAMKLATMKKEVKMAKLFTELKKRGVEPAHLLATQAVLVESGPDAVHLYTVMPKMTGGDLQDLKEHPDLTRRKNACSQFAEGIQMLHAMRIIHGDVKPDNALLVSPETLQVKIIDWGTHANFHEMTEANGFEFAISVLKTLGSGIYNAPERIAASDVDEHGVIQVETPASKIAKLALYGQDGKTIDLTKVESFVKKAEVYSVCMSLYEIMVGELPPHIQEIEKIRQSLPPGQGGPIASQMLQHKGSIGPLPEDAVRKATRGQYPVDSDMYKSTKAYLELLWKGISFNPDERPPLERIM